MIWGPDLQRIIYGVLPVLLLLTACSSKQHIELVPTPLVAVNTAYVAQKAWKYSLSLDGDKAHGHAQEAIVTGDSVYIGDSKGVVHGVDATQGSERWRNETGLSLSSGVSFAAEQGLVLAGSHDGDVIAIDAADGQTRWHSHVSSEVLAPPVVSDGVVVIHSIDGKLSALDINDGRQLWSHQVMVPTLSLHGISVPLIYQGLVVAGLADGRVVALALKDGRVIWETVVAVPQGRSELERLVDVDANPVQFDGVLYAAAYQGRVAAIDMRSGRLIWARDLSVFSGLAVDNKALYIVDDKDALWALSRNNGATLWKQEALLARSLTAPLLTGGQIIVADVEGYVHWLNPRDGSFFARARIAKKEISVLQKDDADALYAVSQDGRMTKLVLEPRPE